MMGFDKSDGGTLGGDDTLRVDDYNFGIDALGIDDKYLASS